ncbi:GNAT family N-acetyltransferase [Cupriavidus sp. 30B13]|uniref:GNAT family N-acetyltransferase n=1 Tax=Cupriavidus sp. 30B13 TaxID=3384241 RepID=UPI003B91A00B
MSPATVVRHCSVSDVESSPDLGGLLAEYGAESGVPELGPPMAQMQTYRQLEAAGVFSVLGAFQGEKLVGFVTVLKATLPHFGRQVAITESLFVTSEARSTGAGLALLHSAESLAREQGAEALLVSAPAGGRLERVLPGVGYRETGRVFFRELM